MRVSWGHCLFVRWTSAVLSLSAIELGVSFTLETWLAGYHKSKYQLKIGLEHLAAIHHLLVLGCVMYQALCTSYLSAVYDGFE